MAVASLRFTKLFLQGGSVFYYVIGGGVATVCVFGFLVDLLWGGALSLPYPVPFNLLGDRAVGWLDTTFVDHGTGLRISRGNKGTIFIFLRQPPPSDTQQTAEPDSAVSRSRSSPFLLATTR